MEAVNQEEPVANQESENDQDVASGDDADDNVNVEESLDQNGGIAD